MGGIYIIVNTLTADFYIGSAKNFKRRKDSHFTSLKHNKHVNTHLQRAYNKYSEEVFVFLIKEEITDLGNFKKVLLDREQYWIDLLKPKYNILKIAGSTLGFNHSEETKQQISNTTKGVKKSKEHAQHIREGQKGRILTEEHKQKLSEAAKNRTKSCHTTKILIDNIEYESLKSASEILNIKYNTIQKRLKSPNFENYLYLNKK